MLTIDRSTAIARLRVLLRADAAEARDLRARAVSLLPVGHGPSRKALRAARRRGGNSPEEVIALRAQDRALRAAAAPSGTTRHALHLRALEAGERARDLGLALAFLRGRPYRQVEPRTRAACWRSWRVAELVLGTHGGTDATRALAKDIDAWIRGGAAAVFAPEALPTVAVEACAP